MAAILLNKLCSGEVGKFHRLLQAITRSGVLVLHYNDVIWASRRINSPVTWTFVQQRVQANNKGHYWPLCEGIHRWPVDSPHKGPVMRKAFPCYDVITFFPSMLWRHHILPQGMGWSPGYTAQTILLNMVSFMADMNERCAAFMGNVNEVSIKTTHSPTKFFVTDCTGNC